jgi:hypothetical protein
MGFMTTPAGDNSENKGFGNKSPFERAGYIQSAAPWCQENAILVT